MWLRPQLRMFRFELSQAQGCDTLDHNGYSTYYMQGLCMCSELTWLCWLSVELKLLYEPVVHFVTCFISYGPNVAEQCLLIKLLGGVRSVQLCKLIITPFCSGAATNDCFHYHNFPKGLRQIWSNQHTFK